ncbi:putative signal peptide peptidase SppA [Phycisphaerae bacterium RAS1]|nr:putative signal peptide peptidase SppA [Phycisphaerae bacterium RAS1]
MRTRARAPAERMWALEPAAFNAHREIVARSLRLPTQPTAEAMHDAAGECIDMSIESGVALIRAAGEMVRVVDPWAALLGLAQFSQDELLSMLARAAGATDVRRIVLSIDSAGGPVTGCAKVAAAAVVKPLTVHSGGNLCSAAYYVASGASQIVAEQDARVGSIGVLWAIADYSAMYSGMGVEVHALASGPLKAVGVIGAEVTPEQLEHLQREVGEIADQFREAVQRGRKLSDRETAAVMSGGAWSGREALRLKLVDSLGTLDQVLAAETAAVVTAATNFLPAPRAQWPAHQPAAAAPVQVLAPTATIETPARRRPPLSRREEAQCSGGRTYLPDVRPQPPVDGGCSPAAGGSTATTETPPMSTNVGREQLKSAIRQAEEKNPNQLRGDAASSVCHTPTGRLLRFRALRAHPANANFTDDQLFAIASK